MNKCSRDSLSCLQNVRNGESVDQFYKEKSLFVKDPFKILYWNSLDLVSIRTLKGIFIDIVPIKAYIRKLFFESLSCSRSSFISCSNFRINILGKDVLDLYGLMSMIFAIESLGPQKFELTETIQEASWF